MNNFNQNNNILSQNEINKNISINLKKQVKSSYILREIFSYLSKKIVLKLIKFNKSLQKKLLYDIEDYREVAGKYKIGGNNGKVQIYTLDNRLIFYGEYLNGKKHGEGKEYYENNGNLKLKGEYLNGELNGKIIEFYENGRLKFEGEYLNGKKHGKGKEYNYNRKNNLIFYGNYLYGKRNGKGKEYNDNGRIIFEGEYLNDKRNGKGKEYIINKEIFLERKYLDGNLIFEEEYLNGEKIEKKRGYYEKGMLYYEGEYLNGKKHGKEKEYYENGNLKIEGEYLNGYKNGNIKEFYENSNLKSEINYLNGKKHGKEKEYYVNGNLKFEGEYLNGYKNGNIKEFYENGNLKFEGEYLNGNLFQVIQTYYENADFKPVINSAKDKKVELEKKYKDDEHSEINKVNIFRILFLGESCVGKTQFIVQFKDRVFNGLHFYTMGIDYNLKDMKLKNGKDIKILLWEIEGGDRFRIILKTYYKFAHAIIFIYDITDFNSFEKLKNLIKQIKKEYNPNAIMYLVGNKNDDEAKREVFKIEGEKLAKELGIFFMEASAKTGDNVNDIFEDIIEKIYENLPNYMNNNKNNSIHKDKKKCIIM